MTLSKGMVIKQIKKNENPLFSNTAANSELTYEVIRVNSKTYGLKCIAGYMKNSCCNLRKDFKEESVDIYGTTTKWVLA